MLCHCTRHRASLAYIIAYSIWSLQQSTLHCSLLHLRSKQSQQMQASRLHHSAQEVHVPPGGQVFWTDALSAALSRWQSSSRGNWAQAVSVLLSHASMYISAFGVQQIFGVRTPDARALYFKHNVQLSLGQTNAIQLQCYFCTNQCKAVYLRAQSGYCNKGML